MGGVGGRQAQRPGPRRPRERQLKAAGQGPRAVLNALDRLAGGYRVECTCVRQNLEIV
jgi:hypothetical protein